MALARTALRALEALADYQQRRPFFEPVLRTKFKRLGHNAPAAGIAPKPKPVAETGDMGKRHFSPSIILRN